MKKKILNLLLVCVLMLQIINIQTLDVSASTVHDISNQTELEAALSEAAANRDTPQVFEINQSFEVDSQIYIDGLITMNLNDNTISFTEPYASFNLSNGDKTIATIRNGTLKYTGTTANSQALLTVSAETSLTCEGLVVEDNITSGFTYGGGISVSGGYLTLSDCQIRNNSITQEGGYSGAGIAFMDGSYGVIINSYINNNISASSGGGIHIAGYSEVNISATVIENNRASTTGSSNGLGGGGINVEESSVSLLDSEIIYNNSGYLSGGLMANLSDVILENVLFGRNTAQVYGGGLTAISSSLEIDNYTEMLTNAAGSAGDNLFIYDYAKEFTFKTDTLAKDVLYPNLDIRYASSSGARDFNFEGDNTTNANINSFFTYEIASYVFDVESESGKLKLMTKPEALPLPMPNAAIDYENETLKGLKPNAEYLINGLEVTANAEGKISILFDWFNSSLGIMEKGNGFDTIDSDIQNLKIPARPVAEEPEMALHGVIADLPTNTLYSLDGGLTWKNVNDGETESIPNKTEILIMLNWTDSSFRSDPITFTTTTYYEVLFGSESVWVEEGLTAEMPKDPVRKGYNFEGWYIDNDTFENKYDFDTLVTNDIRLYAKWTPNTDVPNTGDSSSIMLLLAIILIALSGIGIIAYKKK